jgi:hypothetical protein
MSDSLPPNGGLDPFDGPDLEGLLSGENVRLPDGMRPVARTLAALRTVPTRAELSGEEAARAAFREIMVPAWSESPPPVAAHTLILPTRAADPEPRPGLRPGPRRRPAHRRPPRRGRWRSRAMVAAAGGAAAVVLVGGIVLAGVFSGGSGTPGLAGHSSSASSAAPRTSPAGSNGVMGTASKEATASPSPSHPAGQQSSSGGNAGPSELCRQYLDLIARGPRADRATERDDLRQLSSLAGGAWHVFGYCVQLQPWSMTQNQPGSGADGVGFPANSQSSADSQDSGQGGSSGQGGAGQQQGSDGKGANSNSVGGAGGNQGANGPAGNQKQR